ncbi:Lipoyl synthase [uncultured Desulfobacterium sp.]|uniref:Lipoyl synthase n=1 Tax=uncultured Desulfobacterium sp. TaxID=201089 RepID=A0A445N3S1_9BACT|nr:Lipoyl synthase [uncultured Desulfobacterium sp.]
MKPVAPKWLMAEVRRAKKGQGHEAIEKTGRILAHLGLSTVCDEAGCPNRGECFSHGTATFLILGDVCTRRCAFCAVKHGPPQHPDPDEPEHLALAVDQLGLTHVVITSVTRDDLPDGGSNHYAAVVLALRRRCPEVRIELLVPDFRGSNSALETVVAAHPDVLAHNVETVPGLYEKVRPGADYARSLALLKRAKKLSPGIITKSGFMLGLGEEREEIGLVLNDLLAAGCDMVTIGQYLAPSLAHLLVSRYVSPSEFNHWREKALYLGFRSVAAGPLVRSSYMAQSFFKEVA